jgi:hypothetical protein
MVVMGKVDQAAMFSARYGAGRNVLSRPIAWFLSLVILKTVEFSRKPMILSSLPCPSSLNAPQPAARICSKNTPEPRIDICNSVDNPLPSSKNDFNSITHIGQGVPQRQFVPS